MKPTPTPPRRPAASGPGPLLSPHARGVLPFRAVRVLAFGVISIAIFGCAFIALLAVWDYATRDTAWRALASLGIIAAAMVAFVVVNEVFGASLTATPPPAAPEPAEKPADELTP